MTGLLEIRDLILAYYAKAERILIPLAKFFVVFIAMIGIGSRIPASSAVSGMAPALAVGILGAIIPVNLTAAILAAAMLLQFYSFSIETAAIGGVILLVCFLVYFRFSPKDTWIMILTPVCVMMGIHYIIPVAAGLLMGPAAAVPAVLGLIIAAFIRFVRTGLGNTVVTSDEQELIARVRLMVDGVVQNKNLRVLIAAFIVATVVVYLIRRLRIPHAWIIASVAGGVVELVTVLVGNIVTGASVSVGGAFLGVLLAILTGAVLSLFLFNLDYAGMEDLQFEDDNYYYYVKAVPKVSLAAPVRTVKKINSQREPVREREPEHAPGYAGGEMTGSLEYEPLQDGFATSELFLTDDDIAAYGEDYPQDSYR